jgi:hypothetical protein
LSARRFDRVEVGAAVLHKRELEPVANVLAHDGRDRRLSAARGSTRWCPATSS